MTVEHEDKTVPAIIPINHLTDNLSMAEIIASNLSPGDSLECLAWHKDVVTVLTMKQCVMEHYDTSPRSYEDYRPCTIVPGVVTMIKKFGVFLRLPHLAKAVLCPTRMLSGHYVEDAEQVVAVGQTLWVKVMEVDAEEKKMTCLLYTSPSPRDKRQSRMPSSA